MNNYIKPLMTTETQSKFEMVFAKKSGETKPGNGWGDKNHNHSGSGNGKPGNGKPGKH